MSLNSSDTRPTRKPSLPQITRPAPASPKPAPLASGGQPPRRRGWLGRFLHSPIFLSALSVLVALFLVGAASAAAGWSSGRADLHGTATVQAGLYMLDQYNLAVDDIAAGRYDLARQRLEYIYYQDPNFLDVVDQLVHVMFVLSTTSEPTSAALSEPTATPTQDPRPKEELFSAAQSLLAAHDWTKTIDTLLALRKADSTYRTADVDGMLYAALRNRGVQNIVELGLFEPGLYDFSRAEAFGPLDAQSITYREFARMYLFGNAFWYAYPEQAVYYYGQAMSIAPDLRDASGLSAFYRYWKSLVDWGDALAKTGDWCGAAEKYQLALNARQDNELQPTASFASAECLGPTDVPTFTLTPFLSPTPTVTGTPGPTSTSSSTYTPGATDTPSETPTPSDTSVPSDTPMPSDTPSETPTETPTP